MSILFVQAPLVVNQCLAQRVGLNEAIALQQVHYWIQRGTSGIEHDGRRWIYNTYDEWAEQFPFWSVDQIKRTFASLKKQGVLSIEQLRKTQHDRTNFYAVNYGHDLLRAAEVNEQANPPIRLSENHQSKSENPPIVPADSPCPSGDNACSISANSPDLTETTTENTTETTTEREGKAAAATKPTVGEVIPASAKPVIIEAGGRQFEIPANLKYPGPQTKSHRTWINYAICYQRRYGTWPVWNASMGGMITQFIQRVGEEVAPRVAAYYLSVNDSFIVRQMHPVKLLLSSAEAYHTQYVTGQSMTGTRAAQIDQTQSNYDAASEAMRMLDERRAANAHT